MAQTRRPLVGGRNHSSAHSRAPLLVDRRESLQYPHTVPGTLHYFRCYDRMHYAYSSMLEHNAFEGSPLALINTSQMPLLVYQCVCYAPTFRLRELYMDLWA